MNKQAVIEFFDRCAPGWDSGMVKSDAIIGAILDNALVGPGQDVLDVACGTGVMFPYYLERQVASVTGIDISPEMAKVAAGKYPDDSRVKVLCADVEDAVFDKKFDRIVVYNAFPHFPDPEKLIRVLAGLLKEGGRLTIAHGMSREAIDNHHSGEASPISVGLMEAESLKRLFAPYFQVEVVIDNPRMYQVSGVKGTAHSHGSHAHPHAPLGTHDHPQTPVEEILALMKFMVSHNDAHAQELAELAEQLRFMGNSHAYNRIMDAVADFDTGNARLGAVARELEQE